MLVTEIRPVCAMDAAARAGPPPLMAGAVAAGFPSPAEPYIERGLDLHDHLVRTPAATFFVRVSGESMIGAGILDGDILVMDRSVDPRHGRIVIAAVDGDLTVKRLYRRGRDIRLLAENPRYPAIVIDRPAALRICGVVVGAARRYP